MSKGMEDVLLSNGPLKNEKVDEFTNLLNKKKPSPSAWEKLRSHSPLPAFKKEFFSIIWN